ncbi:MAG: hypothetical protein EBX41_09250, partial [Chitinophagia bacterium]|nr:hypothetical protein [Chitinophagia bacterium]
MNFRKCLLLTFICYLFCCGSALAQIKLPVGFRCVLGQNHPNESYFTNGSVTFKTYPWGHEGMAGQEVADAIQEAYNKKIKFSKTKDNLYWATGKVDEGYVYIIIAQDALQFTIKSKT